LECPELARDPAFATNPARLKNRETLIAKLESLLATRTMAHIIGGLEARKVPVGPVNTLDKALGSEQAMARDMVISMAQDTAASGTVSLLGNPLKLSRSPVSYRRAPPRFGQDTYEVLGRPNPGVVPDKA
ncbi:MAG: CoA transferase, partial [Halocynthiibacter sp.]